MRVIIDTEWDGFKDTATQCWVIVCRDIDKPTDVYVFETPQDWEKFSAFAKDVTLWVGHHVIGFDWPLLMDLGSVPHPARGTVLDTLVLSRLLNYHIEGGHSLEAWAERPSLKKFLDIGPETWYNRGSSDEKGYLQFLDKDTFSVSKSKVAINDFSRYSKELLERCISDTLINYALYKHFERYITSPAFARAIPVEMATAWLCNTLHDNGFAFDVVGAKALLDELSVRLSALDDELTTAFPPVKVLKKTIRPRVTKQGVIFASDYRQLVAAGYDPAELVPDRDFEIHEMVPFNPGSHKQIIERMNDAGWEPTVKTKGHVEALKDKKTPKEKLAHFKVYGWTLDDDNLATLPDTAPSAAKKLVERMLLRNRVALLSAWLELAKDHGDHWRIHGNFNGIGAWTHRFSHDNPNMANVPKAKPAQKPTELTEFANRINNQIRSFWTARPGYRLIGVDADAIHMRIFAHLCDDPRLTEALVRGRKEDGTDIHSVNQRALGHVCKSRDAAKTFIYTLLNGGGAGKAAEIFKCSFEEAKHALDSFMEFYPGYKALKKERFPADLERGYFESIDGRLVVCDDPRIIMSGYLQSGEIVVMKGAADIWNQQLAAEKVPFFYVDAVHDEWQVEVLDDEEVASHCSTVLLDSLARMGDILGLNCPIAGTSVRSVDGYRISKKAEENVFTGGYNWKVTH